MKFFQRFLITIGILFAIGLFCASLFVHYGGYNVSALAQHTAPVYRLLQFAMVRSAKVRSGDIIIPDLHQLDWQQEGLTLYEQHCRQCHGAPGIAPDGFALGMMPGPTAIASIARERDPDHIYWVVEQGIKMSGMPAWEYRLSNRQIWLIVALVKKIPELTVDEYLVLREQAGIKKSGNQENTADDNSKNAGGTNNKSAIPLEKITDDPAPEANVVQSGLNALRQYNCSSCHLIPGISAARNHVGPPLGGVTRRAYIAGLLKNTDENLIQWIRFPRKVDADSAMPDLGVSEKHAREMVAYFYSVDNAK